MMITKTFATILAAIILCSSGGSAWSQTTQQKSGLTTLTAAGSGVNLAITRLLAEAFMREHPQIAIDVPGSIGTQGAIAATIDGAITFGLISRPLKDEEKVLGIVAKPYARVAMVIGANPTVKDNNITSKDLIAILKGVKTRWQDDNEIIVQVRENLTVVFKSLEKQFRDLMKHTGKALRQNAGVSISLIKRPTEPLHRHPMLSESAISVWSQPKN